MQPLSNPARNHHSSKKALYPYYAGFSPEFVTDAVEWVAENRQSPVLLDPWNGAGTTTRVGAHQKITTLGFDLNPVMVLVASADLTSSADAVVLEPLAKKIAAYAKALPKARSSHPLEVFFHRPTASALTNIALSTWYHLVDEHEPGAQKGINDIAPLPALMFVALFNVVRSLLTSLGTSNPTWLRIPKSKTERVGARFEDISRAFAEEVRRISLVIGARTSVDDRVLCSRAYLGDSRALPLAGNSVDGVVTSPPYCTRLDYGRATIAELSLLEALGVASYEKSRAQLIGASITQCQDVQPAPSKWGRTCEAFLDAVYRHPSKASQSYYYKSHYSYFDSMHQSITELSRVLRPKGRICLVAQDSYYKDIHNDLPTIIAEMADLQNIRVVREFGFEKIRSLCSINSNSDPYRAKRKPLEVAILFEKGE